MLNYSDDTLAAQLYADLLHKDHKSMNTDGKREGFKTEKLMGTKKEDGGSSVSREQKFCRKINTLLTVSGMKREKGTDAAVPHFTNFPSL